MRRLLMFLNLFLMLVSPLAAQQASVSLTPLFCRDARFSILPGMARPAPTFVRRMR